ncbi:hypothetical protein [Streptomyces milbemycinicus]|uniref:hypothetical protein n=1 Tax=Streptomyces milbemycinicus TaxID=476552 RepID=UPI00340A5603
MSPKLPRRGNHAQVTAAVAELEHTEAVMLTTSRMSALTTAVLALVSAGDHAGAAVASPMGRLLAGVRPHHAQLCECGPLGSG